jgi:hypothetical protein
MSAEPAAEDGDDGEADAGAASGAGAASAGEHKREKLMALFGGDSDSDSDDGGFQASAAFLCCSPMQAHARIQTTRAQMRVHPSHLENVCTSTSTLCAAFDYRDVCVACADGSLARFDTCLGV